jgi:hypothetical protein
MPQHRQFHFVVGRQAAGYLVAKVSPDDSADHHR